MKDTFSFKELLHALPSVNATEILLKSSIDRLRETISTHPRGSLFTGADSITRRLIIEKVCPEVKFISCCSYVLGTAPSHQDLSSFSTVCLLDVDMPGEEVEGAIKGLFMDVEVKQTIIGVADSETKVSQSLLRAGRFEITERVVLPTPSCRQEAWQCIISSLVDTDPSLSIPENAAMQLSMISPGYGYPDFCAILQSFVAHSTTSLNFKELKEIIANHRPRGGAADLSYVHTNATAPLEQSTVIHDWGKHGGYEHVKNELLRFVEWPVRYESYFRELQVSAPRGILLHGPHGCGKSLLVETFLRRLKYANWLHVEAPDLFSKYLGDSEARIRELFERARQLLPCVILIDELNAIGGNRGFGDEDGEGTGVEHRVLGSLLTELDGISGNEVFVLACAHDVEDLDPALVRPGRIDHILKVDLPDVHNRQKIISRLIEKIPVSSKSEDDEESKRKLVINLADITAGFTGADLEAICRQAAMMAVEETEECEYVDTEYFNRAAEELRRNRY